MNELPRCHNCDDLRAENERLRERNRYLQEAVANSEAEYDKMRIVALSNRAAAREYHDDLDTNWWNEHG